MYIVQDVTFPVWANMVFLNLSTDCLGSIVFARGKSDIAGSITQPSRFKTCQKILEVENELYGAGWPKMGATMALMWLKSVRFIQVLLQTCALALKKYHGWLVQKLFKAAVFAAPYKADFLRALSKRSRKRTAGTKYDFLMYTKMNAEI
uniref:Glycolipid transfer protein a n=1 Tax=Oncorhynchus kisutch TaxID=8019 RepID=A0A8C7F934_ONCKI